MCAAMGGERPRARRQLFVGFPHADIANGRAVGGGGHRQRSCDAQAMVDELLARAWQARSEFMFDIEPLEASVRRAKALGAPGSAGGAARPLRQLRLRRHDGHHRYAGRDHPPGAGRRGVLRHLRSGCGAAGDRGRRRRRVTLSIGAKCRCRDAGGEPPLTSAARCRPSPSGALKGGLTPGCRSTWRTAVLDTGKVTDRAAQPPHRTDRAGEAAGAGHRSRAQEIRRDQEPRALARRPRQGRATNRGMRRRAASARRTTAS